MLQKYKFFSKNRSFHRKNVSLKQILHGMNDILTLLRENARTFAPDF